MKNRGQSLRLEASARLEIALLAVLALCAIGVQRACGEDPPPPPPPPPLPEYVFAYNQPGNVFDNNAAGHVWSELGLLDATGKPGKVGEDGKIRDGNGKVLGSAIKNASGNVIGYRSADGKKEAYNLGGTNPDGTASPGATLDEAWQRVAPNGYLHIIKHGAYWVDDKGVVHKGGGIRLDGGKIYPGFTDKGSAGGGTGAPYPDGPYGLTPRPGANVGIGLNGCWTANDPDGPAQPQKPVTDSAGNVTGADDDMIDGHVGSPGTQLSLELSGNIAAGWDALRRAAEKNGFPGADATDNSGALRWIGSLPFSEQYSTVEATIKGTGATIKKLSYTKKMPAQVLSAAEVDPFYHACPVMVFPLSAGFSFLYTFDNQAAHLTASVLIESGDLPAPTTFSICELGVLPAPLPPGLALATGAFDFREGPVEPQLAGEVDYRLTARAPAPDIQPYFLDGTSWSPMPNYRWEGQELVATTNRVGVIAGLGPVRPVPTLSGVVRDPGGNPVYNACVQVGGYLGPAAITGADGSYRIEDNPFGSVEVYADAVGYAPSVQTVTLPEGPATLDIVLTPKVETGVIVNGDFETEGAAGPSTAAGFEQWYNQWYGNDYLGNPWPVHNDGQYIGIRENGNNRTPGGAWNGRLNMGVPQPNPGVEGIANQGPQGSSTDLTAATMTDAAEAWAIDAYKGWTLVMTGAWDPTLTKSYKIAGNNATTVTIESGDMLADGFAAGDNYDIVRYNYKYWYGCFMRQFIDVDPASKYNFYFKGNWTHNWGEFDEIGIWVFKWESSPGVEINGWVDPRSYIWFNSPGWRQYLTGWFISGSGDWGPMLRMTPPPGASNIQVTFGYFGSVQDPALTGTMLVDDVVVDRIAPPSIAELKTNADGTTVASTTVCTLAPRDANGRVTPWFYVEDASRAAGIRAEGATIIDNVRTDELVTFRGIIRTRATNERYIELAEAPTSAPSTGIPPVGVNTKAVQEDPKLVGILVMVGGTIKEIAPDKSYFTIADGYTKDVLEVATRVEIYGLGGYKLNYLNAGDFVRVIGVVSKKSATESVILHRDLVVPFFATGFEAEEGFAIGPIGGQAGWSIGWDPKAQAANQTVSADKAASGTQALKMLITQKWTGQFWYQTGVTISGPNPCLPNKPLKSLTLVFWLFRETFQDNEFYWYPWARYTDYGNDALNGLVHALVNNTTPRTYGDPGWPEIAGAWVPVKIVDDYVAHTRTVDYNGVVQGPFPIAAGANTGGAGFDIFYNSSNAGNGLPGTATYLDDLKISWVE